MDATHEQGNGGGGGRGVIEWDSRSRSNPKARRMKQFCEVHCPPLALNIYPFFYEKV
jgi:hypothetical protein